MRGKRRCPFRFAFFDVCRMSKKRLSTVKELMFRDSQKLYTFRQEEANLIAEICGAQVMPTSISPLPRHDSGEQKNISRGDNTCAQRHLSIP